MLKMLIINVVNYFFDRVTVVNYVSIDMYQK
jgi:hypothetical protein